MKRPACITAELAEVIGLHLGDGCMVHYFSKGHTSYLVAFTGSGSEYGYYDSFVRPTIESLFDIRGHLYLRDDGTTRYVIYSKELVEYLETLGIPLGKKYDAPIPTSVLKDGQAIPFIRGLYHAEGSIYHRYSKRYNRQIKVYDNLLVIQIRMKLKTLMRQLHQELLGIGIVCNNLIEKDGVYTLRITAQAEIAKFIEVVQPRLKSSPRR
jgi:intein/homing endonuclease